MAEAIQKSPRLIRRGDIVQLKEGEASHVVTDVQIVLRLGNGISDSYSVSEVVTMGVDDDVPAEELVAVLRDDVKAEAERAAAEAKAVSAAAKP